MKTAEQRIWASPSRVKVCRVSPEGSWAYLKISGGTRISIDVAVDNIIMNIYWAGSSRDKGVGL